MKGLEKGESGVYALNTNKLQRRNASERREAEEDATEGGKEPVETSRLIPAVLISENRSGELLPIRQAPRGRPPRPRHRPDLARGARGSQPGAPTERDRTPTNGGDTGQRSRPTPATSRKTPPRYGPRFLQIFF